MAKGQEEAEDTSPGRPDGCGGVRRSVFLGLLFGMIFFVPFLGAAFCAAMVCLQGT